MRLFSFFPASAEDLPDTSKALTRQTWPVSLTASAEAGKLAGYLKSPYQANLAGVPDGLCRGWEVSPGTSKARTRPAWPVSLTASSEAGKLAGYLKSPYPANLAGVPDAPRARKPSAACFDPSEGSETFSGAFWRFPRARKSSAACFDAFRGLGNLQRRVLTLSEGSETSSGVF